MFNAGVKVIIRRYPGHECHERTGILQRPSEDFDDCWIILVDGDERSFHREYLTIVNSPCPMEVNHVK